MFELIDQRKIRADNYIIGFIIFSYTMFALFFRFDWVISITIYPFASLFVFGIIKILSFLRKKTNQGGIRINKLLLGILSIVLSIFFLTLIISQPNVKTETIVNLIAFPIGVVGIAGLVKGIHIKLYSMKHRVINVITGAMTIIFSLLVLFISDSAQINLFITQIVSLTFMLFINIICRAALYLSEFGLSLTQIRNFKLFFYIISDYLVSVNQDGNIILDKIR
ncbi:MAG: DUF308 domain-containing protein [Promethearchaeota archaeon]|jgi:uncharacterized membrane protein HdeD (DUF308 family)